ncbi:Pr6Pr family membrane protein [Klenkia marina]|uniref:Pr6Pr family membrane protein n=1 Tax=Klenkia marina TaxID=1960309 RepID=UPI000B815CFD|nr:Pr6Pr family membrane protein [Klenkia marina]
MSDRNRVARVLWALLALVVLASVLTEFGRTLAGVGEDPEPLGTRVVRFWSYFTIQSNVLTFLAVLPLVRDPQHDGRWWRPLRLTALLGIVVTGLVYAVVLAPTDHPVGLGVWTNAGLHYVAPVAALLGWLVLGPRPRVTWSTVGWAMVWPLAWIAYTLAHGAVSGWYPYPFLDVAALGYATALRNLALVAVLALVLLSGFRLLDRRLPRTGVIRAA